MLVIKKIHLLLPILILSVWVFDAFPQVSSTLGRFEADYDRGCAAFKIILTEMDTFPETTVIQYDFTNNGTFVGFEEGEEISYTYDTPGNYTIIQLTGIDIPGVSKTDTLQVTVFQPLNPDFKIFTCENHGASIQISPDQYDLHKIYYTAIDSITVAQGVEVPPFIYPPGNHSITVKGLHTGSKENCPETSRSFTTIQNLLPSEFDRVGVLEKNSTSGKIELQYALAPDVVYELQKAENFPAGFQFLSYLENASSSIIVDSIDTEDNIQIFRIAAYDACQEKYLYSDTISTITISVTAENSQNKIQWNSFPLNFSQYQMGRNLLPFQVFNNVTQNIYIDHEVECFKTYCYFIQYTNQNGGLSLSDTVCVDAFRLYYPPPIKNTTASVNDREIELSWDDPEYVMITSYFIQRQVDDDVFATIDSTQVRQYTDNDLDTDTRSFCYRVNYLDECRNRSNLGDLTCTMLLTIEDNQLMEWNGYTGWKNGVGQYIVEVYDENGILQDEVNTGLNKWYEDSAFLLHQINQYRVRAESNDSPSLIAYSNFVIKQVESILWVPNSFTPNGDGLNDYFKPEGTQMKQFLLQIYTRYGDLIFTTEDQNQGWDGTYNGKEMPSVTYIYKMKATDELDKKYNNTGQLLLIRQ